MIGELRNRAGERLDSVFTPGVFTPGVFTPGRTGDRSLVVVSHGVTSHHDRPYLTALCDALGRRGIGSLRFSFAGNGASEGSFAAATIGKEVEDLGAVLDACGDRQVAFVGHSMGAAVGVLRAAQDPRIRALVSLAGMVDVQGFCERHFRGLVPGRDVMFGRTGCVLSPAFVADAARIGTVLAPAAAITVPWLLVHGDQDELVPLAEAEAAHAANGRAALSVLAGVDHRFTGAIDRLVAVVAPWLARTLELPPK